MSSFFYAGGSLSSAGAIKTGTESDRCVRRLCRVRPTFPKVCIIAGFRVVEFRYFGVLSANVSDVLLKMFGGGIASWHSLCHSSVTNQNNYSV